MSVKSFKFISPGIFINEIDNSQLPAVPDEVGPVVIGRTERGPGMRPVKVNSFSQFVEIFGNPIPGGQGGDVWRDGNYTAPTYAAYAAQAYLRNSDALTVVRLLGAQSSQVAENGAGEAGWYSGNGSSPGANDISVGSNAGAYGLFVFPSASHATAVTGALAAVWYLESGAIELSGALRGDTSDTGVTGSAALIQSVNDGTANEFKVLIKNSSGTNIKTTTFNFSPDSSKFIRKVFNTNPTLVNSDVTDSDLVKTYWLGPTYERHLAKYATGSAGAAFGVILGLDSGSTGVASDFKYGFQAAQTPWIISQDMQNAFAQFDIEDTSRVTKLFKFHTLDAGDDEMKKVKISITDIKASTNEFDPYGSFSVELRDARDSDNAPIVLERFSSVNLNPNSAQYIARVIGDQFLTWDDTERRHIVKGNYPNASSYVRVEVYTDVDRAATEATLLPFGHFGPLRFNQWEYTSGSAEVGNVWASASGSIPFAMTGDGDGETAQNVWINVGRGTDAQLAFTGRVIYPAIPLRVSASDGNISDPKDAYFGIDSTQASNNRFEESYKDVVRPLPEPVDTFTRGIGLEYSYLFSLDDVKPSAEGASSAIGVWESGSRVGGNSYTALSSSYKEVLDQGYNRFTVPLHGGYDGFNVKEKEPFNNTDLEDGTDTTNYAYYSVRRAIDTVADPEVVEYNLMATPGIWNESLTDHMIEVCENRGDALAVIDLKTGYYANTENTNSDGDNLGSVTTAVNNLRNRKINSSYGTAYYPWVQIRDTISDSLLFVPPSIVALGTFSSAQRNTELWFAPAGFTRGGLTEGSAGLPVIQTRERLTSRDRDDLYEANINPIATFPAEGIVIFGQKTLQVTPSALDRVNVRRLMIFLKREISRIAATTLFDQNVQATWNRFKTRADALLASVQARLGLTDYKIVLDSTTTTPELVDRNILYAKIFLKPARAIEFIALDFVITNSGAGFED